MEVAYQVNSESRGYGFVLGDSDPTQPLWMDPILQSTYLGGSNFERSFRVAIHPGSGEVYVAGFTASTTFPNTAGGAQATYGRGSFDAFAARLTAGLALGTLADMGAALGDLPRASGPGQTVSGLSFSCTNNSPDPAADATCSITASSGTVSSVVCIPPYRCPPWPWVPPSTAR